MLVYHPAWEAYPLIAPPTAPAAAHRSLALLLLSSYRSSFPFCFFLSHVHMNISRSPIAVHHKPRPQACHVLKVFRFRFREDMFYYPFPPISSSRCPSMSHTLWTGHLQLYGLGPHISSLTITTLSRNGRTIFFFISVHCMYRISLTGGQIRKRRRGGWRKNMLCVCMRTGLSQHQVSADSRIMIALLAVWGRNRGQRDTGM